MDATEARRRYEQLGMLTPWDDMPENQRNGIIDLFAEKERMAAKFVAGAQAFREMIARFVEQGGDVATAASIRANWHPSWGSDPGAPDFVETDPWKPIP